MPFVIELEQDVFMAPVAGDPGRTTLIHNARIFRSLGTAKRMLEEARTFRPFEDAIIVPVAVRLEKLI